MSSYLCVFGCSSICWQNFLWITFASLLTFNWPYICGSISQFLLIFIDLFFFLVTVPHYSDDCSFIYSKSQNKVVWVLQLCQIVWVIGFLQSSMNFGISLLILKSSEFWECSESVDQFGDYWHLNSWLFWTMNKVHHSFYLGL